MNTLCEGSRAFATSKIHVKYNFGQYNFFVLPGDVPRVDGQLAVSRAFGDKSLKIHMRADPDIMIEDIDETTEFLVLASDGLWKVKNIVNVINPFRKINENILRHLYCVVIGESVYHCLSI